MLAKRIIMKTFAHPAVIIFTLGQEKREYEILCVAPLSLCKSVTLCYNAELFEKPTAEEQEKLILPNTSH